MFLAALGYLRFNGFRLQLDMTGLLLALCYCLDLAMTGTLVSACYQCGPMSVTSVITNACVLLGVAFLLSGLGGKEKAAHIAPKWYPLAALAFSANGIGRCAAESLNIKSPVGRQDFLRICLEKRTVL